MDETRQKLIDAAGEVFASRGFTGATVREICQLAGANIAAVNYHFGSKEQLYIEAVKAAHCQQEPLEPLEWPPGTTPEQALEMFIRHMLVDMLDRECPSWHLELIMQEMAQPTAACTELVRSFIGPKFDLLCSILEQLLPPGISQSQRYLFAFSIVGQCLLYRFHRPVGRLLIGDAEFEALFDVERLTAHITAFSLDGLRRAVPERRSQEVSR